MDYDEVTGVPCPPVQVLEHIGEFGAWQRSAALWCWLPSIMGGIHALMYSFTGMGHRLDNC